MGLFVYFVLGTGAAPGKNTTKYHLTYLITTYNIHLSQVICKYIQIVPNTRINGDYDNNNNNNKNNPRMLILFHTCFE